MASKLIRSRGWAGVILPTGIATDDTTKDFFADLIQNERLVSMLGFTNWEFIFPDVGDRFSFCLMTLTGDSVHSNVPLFMFYAHNVGDLNQEARTFRLSKHDIALINPNTFGASTFRTKYDAELTKKIYLRIPVLIHEVTETNPWGISFKTMFHMSNDSSLFFDTSGLTRVPLYEAKMFWHFDHRYGSYNKDLLDSTQASFRNIPTPSLAQYQDPNFVITPRYFVEQEQVIRHLENSWQRKWLLSYRDITLAVNERTAIFSILPLVGIANTAPIIMLTKSISSVTCLMANFCALVFDYVARQKIGGTHLNFFIFKQLPVLPPDRYTPADIAFISPRVLELVYTAWDMQPFARDCGYEGDPFIWDEDRRALLRAELDAYYAHLYGLTRDELRYILDPADVYGPDFPGETFRVLKEKETKAYGEYRTRRLVLEAWDRLGF